MFKANNGHTVNNTSTLTINGLHDDDTGLSRLSEIRFDGREAGLLDAPDSRNMRSWLLFPTLRLPMLMTDRSDEEIVTQVAPVPDSVLGALGVRSIVMGFDEVHLIQAARLFRNDDNQLVRVVFHGNHRVDAGWSAEILARNIVGLQFVFNPVSRLLTMYIAARGDERDTARGTPAAWPSWLPEQIPPEEARRRVAVKTLTWRIRN
jgi:hypothetical protein